MTFESPSSIAVRPAIVADVQAQTERVSGPDWLELSGARRQRLTAEVIEALLVQALETMDPAALATAIRQSGVTGASDPSPDAWAIFRGNVRAAAANSIAAVPPLLEEARRQLLAVHDESRAVEELRARLHLLLGYAERESLSEAPAPSAELGHIELNEDARARMQRNLQSSWDNAVALLRQSGLWGGVWEVETSKPLSYQQGIAFWEQVYRALATISAVEYPDVAVVREVLTWTAINVAPEVVAAVGERFSWHRAG